ncbi:MAG: methyl-accepting chemotaxis protein, partial [Cyanobacteria bacterium J06639_1]
IGALVAILSGVAIAVQRNSIVEQKKAELKLQGLNQSLENSAKEQQEQREALELEINKLMEDVEAAADGDLTVRAAMVPGDVGIIADLFNAIIENLQEIAGQVRDSSGQVSSSLGQNEESILQLADKSAAEAEEIRNTLGSIEQMSASILAVSNNAGEAANIADDTYALVQEGSAVMNQTVSSIQSLRGTVGDTAKKMKRLGESAQKISQVVTSIDEIALKTNLLAINASVEAGRAGEYGQGFTAVAEQVGALAEQSAAATKDIAQIVNSIQAETQEVLEAMEMGTTQVVDSTRLVESTKSSLNEILLKSQSINTLMQNISQSTDSQAETSQVVTQLMQQVTAASDSRSHLSRQVAEAIQSTASVAEKLQSSVEQFKA